MNWDPNLALSITSELVVMEVINRIFICVFEVSVALQVANMYHISCGCSFNLISSCPRPIKFNNYQFSTVYLVLSTEAHIGLLQICGDGVLPNQLSVNAAITDHETL